MIDGGAQELLDALLRGRFVDPASGTRFASPVGTVRIADDLDGAYGDLVGRLRLGRRLAIVADPITWEVLGHRVAAAIPNAQTVILRQPRPDAETVEEVRRGAGRVDALVAVGSGTINDVCKVAAFRDQRRYALFATAPSMNGYLTSVATIMIRGVPCALAVRAPCAAFFDLAVLAQAPQRMIRAGIGQCLARSTAQVDWLLAHHLWGHPYSDTPFEILAEDEALVLEHADAAVAGDRATVAALVRVLVLAGLGAALAGSTHPLAMGESLISDYIDLMASPHPGSLHGEQVGVAAWTVARLQAAILARDEPPAVGATWIDEETMRQRFGPLAQECIKALKRKALDGTGAAQIGKKLAMDWPRLRARLRAAMLPLTRIERAMQAAGLPMTAEALGIPRELYRDAVRHGRELRDRYGILDLAADAGILHDFAEQER
jgi:glycerol-1-phosphate dehydrogenase [NAD(P)+]